MTPKVTSISMADQEHALRVYTDVPGLDTCGNLVQLTALDCWP